MQATILTHHLVPKSRYHYAGELQSPGGQKSQLGGMAAKCQPLSSQIKLAMPYMGICTGFFHSYEKKGAGAVKESPYYTEGNTAIVTDFSLPHKILHHFYRLLHRNCGNAPYGTERKIRRQHDADSAWILYGAGFPLPAFIWYGKTGTA